MRKFILSVCVLAAAAMSFSGCTKADEKTGPTSACTYAFGYNQEDANTGWSNEILLAYGFTMTSDVVVKRLVLRLSTASDYVVGVYTDSSGSPNTRLSQSAITAGNDGWNTAVIPDITLASGTKYWLVLCTEAPAARGNNANAAVCKYNPYPWASIVSGNGLPATYTTWQIADTDGDIKIYAMTCN